MVQIQKNTVIGYPSASACTIVGNSETIPCYITFCLLRIAQSVFVQMWYLVVANKWLCCLNDHSKVLQEKILLKT